MLFPVKISIIMTTHNRAALIDETIDSILAQEYKDWELVIVDDGSTDDTAAVLAKFTDPRIKYHYFDRIGYGIKLRATGIDLACGEWIAFADSDDLWSPRKLAQQVNAFARYPAADFCLTGGYNFKEKDKPLEYFYKNRNGIFFGDLLLPMFRSEVSLFPQTLLFKRNCLPAIYASAEKWPGADIGFLTGLAALHKGVVLYEDLLYRRIHELNFSSREWEHGYREGLEMANRFRNEGLLKDGEARAFLFRLYINYGEKCLVKKKHLASLGKFFKAWTFRPFSLIPARKMGKLLLSLLAFK